MFGGEILPVIPRGDCSLVSGDVLLMYRRILMISSLLCVQNINTKQGTSIAQGYQIAGTQLNSSITKFNFVVFWVRPVVDSRVTFKHCFRKYFISEYQNQELTIESFSYHESRKLNVHYCCIQILQAELRFSYDLVNHKN